MLVCETMNMGAASIFYIKFEYSQGDVTGRATGSSPLKRTHLCRLV